MKNDLIEALRTLDPTNPDQWTQGGYPNPDTIKDLMPEAYGDMDAKAKGKFIREHAPGLTQEKFSEWLASLDVADQGEGAPGAAAPSVSGASTPADQLAAARERLATANEAAETARREVLAAEEAVEKAEGLVANINPPPSQSVAIKQQIEANHRERLRRAGVDPDAVKAA